MKKNRKKEWILETGKGILFGIILFFSAVFSLMFTQDMKHLQIFSENLFPIMGGYIFIVLIIKILFSISWIRKIGIIFQGAGILWWGWLFALAASIGSGFIPDYMRNIIITHLFLLFILYVGRFIYIKWIADELNRGKWKKGFVFVEDIDERPKGEDAFMQWIDQYCRKNGLDYDILHYGMPAEIKMDGIDYKVEVFDYASMASGIIPAIKFTRL